MRAASQLPRGGPGCTDVGDDRAPLKQKHFDDDLFHSHQSYSFITYTNEAILEF